MSSRRSGARSSSTCPARAGRPLRVLPFRSLTTLLVALALLDELGHERADVVGFSLGGMVAQQLAHDAADRVRRLALVGTGCGLGGMPPTLQALDASLDAAPLPLRARIPRDEPAAHGGRPCAARPPLIAERIATSPPAAATRLRLPTRGRLACGRASRGSTRCAVPTLVLVGSVDQVVPPANGYQLARLLPTSRLHVLDGGHLCLFDPDGPAVELDQRILRERGVRGVEGMGLRSRNRRRRRWSRRSSSASTGRVSAPRRQRRLSAVRPPPVWGMGRPKCVRATL